MKSINGLRSTFVPTAATSCAATLVSLLTLANTNAMGQDIEVTSAVFDRRLPAGYWQRVSREPDFFEIGHGWSRRAALARQASHAVAGVLPLVVLPVLFADSRMPPFEAADLQRVLFDGPSVTGTLTDFYEQVSSGQLTIAGSVLPWVRTSLSIAEVRGESFGLGDDAKTPDFLIAGLALADGATDFSVFDNDGLDGIPNSGDDDGVVDAIAIEFLEAPLTCTGNGPTIWAHRSRISNWIGTPFATDDLRPNGQPVIVDDYIVQAAVRCHGQLQRATTIAHELGHILGLPDLYDRTEGILPTLRNWVVGCWSLMAAGTWGCGPALERGEWDRPTHFGPWEKAQLGWLPNLRKVGTVLNAEFVLSPVETSGEVLRVSLSSSEYLLIEYRDRSGFDRNLPAAGVLVYHVDESRPLRRCRSCPQLYRVALIEADANAGLIKREGEGGNRGEAGDVFGIGARLTNGSQPSAPSTRLNSGSPSRVSVYAIDVVDGAATINLSTVTLELDRLVQPFVGRAVVPLTPAEQTYLDAIGNQNGVYDLGDLRRYLLEHPSVVPAARGSP